MSRSLLNPVLACVSGLLASSGMFAQTIAFDASALQPGPVSIRAGAQDVTVEWKDEQSRTCTAVFSLDARRPLISSISVAGKVIIERARPYYHAETGKRRGGWDAFFDF